MGELSLGIDTRAATAMRDLNGVLVFAAAPEMSRVNKQGVADR